MTDPGQLDKVRGLLRLAQCESAAPGEAANAAVAAARLMGKLGLDVVDPATAKAEAERTSEDSAAPRGAPNCTGRRPYISRWDGACRECGELFVSGVSRVWWGKDRGAVCRDCAELGL